MSSLLALMDDYKKVKQITIVCFIFLILIGYLQSNAISKVSDEEGFFSHWDFRVLNVLHFIWSMPRDPCKPKRYGSEYPAI